MKSGQGSTSLGRRDSKAAVEGRPGPRLPGRRMILVLTLLVSWIATFFQGNVGAAAEKACYESIRAALHDSGSVAFSDVTRSGGDPVWTVNATADVENSQGAATHIKYVCRTHHEPGSTDWNVDSLSR